MADWQWFALGTAFGVASTVLTIARILVRGGRNEGSDHR